MKYWLILLLFLFVGCARYGVESQSLLLFSDKSFMNGDITVEKGCSMVVMPVVYKGRFFPSPSVATLSEPLTSRHDFLTLYSLEDAAEGLPKSGRDSLLAIVPEAVQAIDILQLGEVSPLIRKAGIAFFQTVIVKDMASVRTANGELLRKIKIEVEIWDTKKRQVLWRAEGTSRTLNQKLGDEEVLLITIKELYQLLPKFYFSTVHETW